jgi:two-component system OmpR family sensor kinase
MKLTAPHSLRRRLLWLLLAAIVLTALAQGVVAYRTARVEADDIFDYHMQQMAMSLRSGFPVSGAAIAGHDALQDESLEFMVQVWSEDGLRIYQSASAVLPDRAVLGFSNIKARGTTYRVFSMQSRTQVIQVAQDMAARRAMASTLALKTVVPIALMAPLLMLIVWWVVGTSLATVSRVQRQVAERQADDLTEVSELGLPDEVRPLVHELNLLFGRVRAAFEAQQSFVADAAHELRSPLAALKLQAQSLQRATDEATRELAVGRLSAGIDRATRLVEQLLILARQQASNATGAKPEPVDLSGLARLALADMMPAAQARKIDLGLNQADAGKTQGHAEALRILVRNLLENAVKYTPPGGKVDLDIRRMGASLVLSVEDSGPGIPEQDRARALDRFYRVPGSAVTGSGLGLAIVKSIAELHGAQVLLDASPRLGGLRVQVLFPAVNGLP